MNADYGLSWCMEACPSFVVFPIKSHAVVFKLYLFLK